MVLEIGLEYFIICNIFEFILSLIKWAVYIIIYKLYIILNKRQQNRIYIYTLKIPEL